MPQLYLPLPSPALLLLLWCPICSSFTGLSCDKDSDAYGLLAKLPLPACRGMTCACCCRLLVLADDAFHLQQ